MKDLIEKYGYFIPNKYKVIDTSKYKYKTIKIFDQEWKYFNPDLLKVDFIRTNEIIDLEKYSNKESKSSLAIENITPENTKNYDEYFKYYNDARDFLLKLKNIESREILNKIYLISTNNEKLIDEGNEKLNNKHFFRQNEIFIGNQEIKYKGSELEKYVDEFMDYVNENINENFGFEWIFFAHFFFEHLHPFPDYNGRIGRLLLSWLIQLNKNPNFNQYNNISNYIENNRTDYNQSIELSEKYNDLTYILIFLVDCWIENSVFINITNDNESDYYEKYNQLSEQEQQVLFNLFSKPKQFGWNEYKDYFKDKRTKQQIHNVLRKLENLELIKSDTYKNNLKRYYCHWRSK